MKTNVKNQKSFTVTKIELHMCANPDYLRVARTATRDVAQVIGLKDDQIEKVTLAVVEALTNIIRHSYGGPCENPIIIKLNKINYPDVKKAGMEIVIRDFGKQVDPENIKGRDLDELKPGGVGVHIIHTTMDEVEFTRGDDCGMQLRMVKYLD
ncbi:MAG: ATP-binding protein [Planctomycetota bacterium]|jgi:anti-sigma regulatory factor (Ser/Thr protein kinase)